MSNTALTIDDYGAFETAWCPGCGNFGILDALKQALVAAGLAPHQVLMVSGIGQAAKTPHYLNANVFNGLHGRALPVATGVRLANPTLNVLVESGDGCMYGEGGNHFLAAIRRNLNITVLVHDNQVYGLT
ncbi:MAG: thiamine pyrophosphate-dependent enzyme, partial [Lentisphaeria bacterium]